MINWSATYSIKRMFVVGFRYRYPWRFAVRYCLMLVCSFYLSLYLYSEIRTIWAVIMSVYIFSLYQLMRFLFITISCFRYKRISGGDKVSYSLSPRNLKLTFGKDTVIVQTSDFEYYKEVKGMIVLKRHKLWLNNKLSLWFDNTKAQKQVSRILKERVNL